MNYRSRGSSFGRGRGRGGITYSDVRSTSSGIGPSQPIGFGRGGGGFNARGGFNPVTGANAAPLGGGRGSENFTIVVRGVIDAGASNGAGGDKCGVTTSNNENNDIIGSCFVCHESIKREELTAMLCGHTFHMYCIGRQIEYRKHCPTCQQDDDTNKLQIVKLSDEQIQSIKRLEERMKAIEIKNSKEIKVLKDEQKKLETANAGLSREIELLKISRERITILLILTICICVVLCLYWKFLEKLHSSSIL